MVAIELAAAKLAYVGMSGVPVRYLRTLGPRGLGVGAGMEGLGR